MQQQRFFVLIISLIVLTACQPEIVQVEVTRMVVETAVTEVTRIVPDITTTEVTRVVPEEIILEVTKSPLGSESRPVQLLFPPVVETAVISERGEELAQALTAATDRRFVVGILDNEQAVIDMLCNAPQDTIGFISASAYVLAAEQCDVQVGTVAVHTDQYPWQTGMVVTRRDSGINELEDLEGKSWAVADNTNIPDFLYFQALLDDAGIEPGEIIEVSGDSAAMLAVLNQEADFATASYIPPIMPFEERLWQYGEDNPEPTRHLGLPATRSPIGYVLVNGEPEFGGYRLRDARSRIFDVEPEIYDRTKIITLSAPIPNETVAFGADFPLGLARDVVVTLMDFAGSEACATSLCAADFYDWTGLQMADDINYAPLRFVQSTLDLEPDEVLNATQ